MTTFQGPHSRINHGARLIDDGCLFGDAEINDNSQISGRASLYGNAKLFHDAQVSGDVTMHGWASACDQSRITGRVRMTGHCSIRGAGDIAHQDHVAWVDRVGSGQSITLHRIRAEDGYGWRINAGCRYFEASTPNRVCNIVRNNISNGPVEWDMETPETQTRYANQVLAALLFLESMVNEDTY